MNTVNMQNNPDISLPLFLPFPSSVISVIDLQCSIPSAYDREMIELFQLEKVRECMKRREFIFRSCNVHSFSTGSTANQESESGQNVS